MASKAAKYLLKILLYFLIAIFGVFLIIRVHKKITDRRLKEIEIRK